MIWTPKGDSRFICDVEIERARLAPIHLSQWLDLLGKRVQQMVDADPDLRGTLELQLVHRGVASRMDFGAREYVGNVLVELAAPRRNITQEWPACPPFFGRRARMPKPGVDSLSLWIARAFPDADPR